MVRRVRSMTSPKPPTSTKALSEIDDIFDELDMLLKSSEVGAELADRGINVSLALVAADGLRAYLHGEKEKAAEDLATAAEEIALRRGQGRAEKPS